MHWRPPGRRSAGPLAWRVKRRHLTVRMVARPKQAYEAREVPAVLKRRGAITAQSTAFISTPLGRDASPYFAWYARVYGRVRGGVWLWC